MINKAKPKLRLKHPRPALERATSNDASADVSKPKEIVERPDGYYWIATKGLLEFGPYESYELALRDSEATSEEALAPIETLHSAERQIGIADWIDPQTGSLPEGESPPHIEED